MKKILIVAASAAFSLNALAYDKTFKSHMELKGEELDVEGCISFLCQGQHWQRVK